MFIDIETEGMEFQKLYDDALTCTMGAVNPVAVSRAIAVATTFLSREGYDHPQIQQYPPVRLMVHQLAHLFGVASIMDIDEYENLTDYCLVRCSESVKDMWERR